MLRGIDISNHQAGLDLTQIDFDFVVIKATEGIGFVDRYCDGFYQTAKKMNKLIGFYHFGRPTNDPIREARFFYENTKNYFGEAVPVLDIEIHHSNLVEWCRQFLNEIIQLTGIKPMIYMSEQSFNWRYDWTPVVKLDCGLWVAKYRDGYADYNYDMSNAGSVPQVKWWNGYAMWQWTSNGRLNGYNGNLDCDVFYGDANAWKAYATSKSFSGFRSRTTDPEADNPYYRTDGYNRCIEISGGSALPNCCGYAYGRFMEECGITECNLSRRDAENWYPNQDGYERGSVPKVGAVICWRKGETENPNDGRGHVAIVEEIYSDGSILVSQSNYSGARFETKILPYPYQISGQILQGFIYNPFLYEAAEPQEASVPMDEVPVILPITETTEPQEEPTQPVIIPGKEEESTMEVKTVPGQLAKLIDVKSLITLSLTAAFVYLAISGKISEQQMMTIYTVIVGFYFGTQATKKGNV